MPTVTTTVDETFEDQTIDEEAADGAGLSLREIIEFFNSDGSDEDGMIDFDASLDGLNLDITSRLLLLEDFTFDGGTIDIGALDTTGAGFFDIGSGLTINLNNFNLTADLSQVASNGYRGITAHADDISIINSSDIAIIEGFFDFSFAISVRGNNFSLNNTGNIISSGYGAVGSASGSIGFSTTIDNQGTLESAGATIRTAYGVINNSGTIRTTGEWDSFDVAGTFSDAISMNGSVPEGFVPSTEGVSTINNSGTGLIEGYRVGVSLGGGGTINNDGTITALTTAISTSDFVSTTEIGSPDNPDLIFDLTNTGTIARLGGFEGGVLPEAIAAVSVSQQTNSFTTASITNSGDILSVDTVIRAFGGLDVTNEMGGIIRGDTDATGNDAIAFRGSIIEDFQVSVGAGFFGFFSAGNRIPGQLETSQNVDFDENGNLVTEFGTFPFEDDRLSLDSFLSLSSGFGGGAIEGVNRILALVDFDATIADGVVRFVVDAEGRPVFADTLEVTSTNLGTLIISYDASAAMFAVTDQNGDPVYNISDITDFADTITNDGSIFGDVITGLGNDLVTNNGIIDGDVDLGAGNDLFTGGADNETVEGGAGSDTLIGNGGGDTLSGGDGFDDLFGGDQGDTLIGGAGNDRLFGQRGADTLEGGLGNDLLLGGNRNDRLFGEAGNDRVFGGNDQDMVDGGAGRDIVRGGNGDDMLFGGAGRDVLFGGTGRDELYGGTDDDFLSGRGGFDILNGGAGNDTLEGGVQADQFIFEDGWGNDTILDFAALNNAERIHLTNVSEITDFQDLTDNHMVQDGANVLISDGLGNTITINGVNISDLDAADFVF